MKPTHTIPELCNDSRALADALRAVAPGDTVDYPKLSAVAHRNVLAEGRHLLRTARRLVLADRLVFEPVRGVGLRRMTDEGLAAAAPSYTRRVHRCAKTGAKKLLCAEIERLEGDDKTRLLSHAATLGVVAHVTHPKKVLALAANLSPVQPIPMPAAMRATLRGKAHR